MGSSAGSSGGISDPGDGLSSRDSVACSDASIAVGIEVSIGCLDAIAMVDDDTATPALIVAATVVGAFYCAI